MLSNYLSLVNSHAVKFHVINVHGRLQPGWTLPPDSDVRVDDRVMQLVADELEEIIVRAIGNEGGDSEPRLES